MEYSELSIAEAGGESDDVLLWRQFKYEENEDAFGKLAAMYYRQLFNYGGRFSEDTEFIRDCIQELFIKLWERRTRVSVPLSVKAYLFTSLRRIILDESETRRRFRRYAQLYFDPGENQEPLEHYLIESENQRLRIRQLTGIISKLTKRQQEVIYLRFYQGLDNDQVAQVMGLGRQSMANLLYRTLREIRNNWLAGEQHLFLVWAMGLNLF